MRNVVVRLNIVPIIVGLLLLAAIAVAFGGGRAYQSGLDQPLVTQYTPSSAGR